MEGWMFFYVLSQLLVLFFISSPAYIPALNIFFVHSFVPRMLLRQQSQALP
jgi:hypothetical protein